MDGTLRHMMDQAWPGLTGIAKTDQEPHDSSRNDPVVNWRQPQPGEIR
ncbi:hypothetical protein AA0311_2742 [Asaia bogorensis NBRC 16594]|nr:hypothetical protein AA0311_2742 [Asaia bogorensis NBRC 16594]